MGGYRLPVSEERGTSDQARLRLVHPSQEAQGPADGGAHPYCQCPQIQSPLRCRARLRLSERANGLGCAHDWNRQGAGEDRPCQSRLQHAAVCLARRAKCARCSRLSAEAGKPKNPPPRKPHPNRPCHRCRTGRSPTILQSAVETAFGGVRPTRSAASVGFGPAPFVVVCSYAPLDDCPIPVHPDDVARASFFLEPSKSFQV